MTDLTRSLDAGARLGPYEILGLLGRGGMAEVYRANDTRLNRTVAIKVLPSHTADRPDRRQRLEREARAISSLNHPHICALYDVGEHEGALFLVMELVAGETLADRLLRGPLPLDVVVQCAIDIADALDHAHRQGITHRDLKPGNIMLSPSGVKLLDFGLVKLRESDRPAADEPSPTKSAATESLTDDGTILGTLPYMAPEQLEGGEADARSDIFAVGAIIYEMATARRAFRSESRAGLIASILEHHPPSLVAEYRTRRHSGVERISLPLLDHVVTRCLAKQPDERWQTSADLTRELRWIASGHDIPDAGRAGAHRTRNRVMAWAGGLITVSALAALTMLALRPATPPIRAARFVVSPNDGTRFSSGPAAPQLAISPDGQWLAFTATTGEHAALWVRDLNELSAREVPGTTDARLPFWSPDSHAIGFFAQGFLKTVRLNGEPPKSIAPAPEPEGGAWSSTGVILFAPAQESDLLRVPAEGGACTAATHRDVTQQERRHSWPSFLPDGRRFLYFVLSDRKDSTGLYLQSLDAPGRTFLIKTSARGVYTPPGFLLFGRENALMAQSFDATRALLDGEPEPIAQGVASTPAGRMPFSASATGVLVYRGGGTGGVLPSTLQWLDRAGTRLDALGTVARYSALTTSPDGDTITAIRNDESAPVLWLFDRRHGGPGRQFVDQISHGDAVWSQEGRALIYTSHRDVLRDDLVEQQISGAGGELSILKQPGSKYASSWSRIGPYLLYGVLAPAPTGWDIWALPLFGDRKPIPYLVTTDSEGGPRFSPDGRWVAYTASSEGGRRNVFVQSFPISGAKYMISPAGGSEPQWRQDGRELFYLDLKSRLVSVTVKTGATFEYGPPEDHFTCPVNQGLSDHYASQYVVTPDGQRFLCKVEQTQDAPVTVVFNWMATLAKVSKK